MTAEYVCQLKLVLLGESSVGKSSIVTRFTTGEFHKNQATIGAAFTTRTISWKENPTNRSSEELITKSVNFEIWDTAGQERYRSLAPMYYRNTDVALIVFDITDESSLEKAQSWIDELNTYVDESRQKQIVIKIVGNKMDLKDSKFVKGGWKTVSLVSAKSGEGIEDLFMCIAKEVPKEKFLVKEVVNKKPKNILNLLGTTSSNDRCNC
ncbi:Rab family GTPase YPT10 Ecym_6309 [Eremothecium cymbalariae DBVPG|uniref:GTP-binding protein YPT52 n=1 Tax=Eremothecium cymbalariae (strain CBS 270.75 / DBVPG 7215 / KCTC 17166 / NRRL Y-17582) TaxID=931890 RepID=G8JUA8_ERECY|nr:hypothetical protein Ecym_6309 [Eremothecium cymbalariae DBVPG\